MSAEFDWRQANEDDRARARRKQRRIFIVWQHPGGFQARGQLMTRRMLADVLENNRANRAIFGEAVVARPLYIVAVRPK